MINFLKNLILTIVWFSETIFFLYLIKNNEFIKEIFNFFLTNIKNQEIAVAIFVLIFLGGPVALTQIIWQKIFHR